jgi:hypothetical protein|tara:strand:- start:443 stop:664 length:222 start_codon:yes stop_codon:yes gene_type:complete
MEENIKIYTLKQKQSLFRSSLLQSLYSRSRENKNKPNARPKTKETAVTIVGILVIVVGPPFSAKKLLLMLPLL